MLNILVWRQWREHGSVVSCNFKKGNGILTLINKNHW